MRPTGRLVIYGFRTMMPKTGGKPHYGKLAVDWLRTPRFNPLKLTEENRSVMGFNLSYLFDRPERRREHLRPELASHSPVVAGGARHWRPAARRPSGPTPQKFSSF